MSLSQGPFPGHAGACRQPRHRLVAMLSYQGDAEIAHRLCQSVCLLEMICLVNVSLQQHATMQASTVLMYPECAACSWLVWPQKRRSWTFSGCDKRNIAPWMSLLPRGQSPRVISGSTCRFNSCHLNVQSIMYHNRLPSTRLDQP